jgi:hypothetical protein
MYLQTALEYNKPFGKGTTSAQPLLVPRSKRFIQALKTRGLKQQPAILIALP